MLKGFICKQKVFVVHKYKTAELIHVKVSNEKRFILLKLKYVTEFELKNVKNPILNRQEKFFKPYLDSLNLGILSVPKFVGPYKDFLLKYLAVILTVNIFHLPS